MPIDTLDYHQFLQRKRIVAPVCGFDVPLAAISSHAKPFQRDIIHWALRRGRAGVFPDTGLGKTLIQLEIASHVCQHTGRDFLILAPLAVSQQTIREAAKFSIATPISYAWDQSVVKPGITITNYEKLHKFDPEHFVGIGLDEGSILKSIDGKTRGQLIESFRGTPYRFVFTATPSPNDTMELGSYCEFLGIMSAAEMKATFFTHDGGDTSKWRLRGHAEQRFYEWMATWAVMLRKPSDLGYDDAGYILPPLNFHEHFVEASGGTHITEKWGKQGTFFKTEARTLTDQRGVRQETIADRAAVVGELANADFREPWIVWCGLNDESTAATAAVVGAVEVTGSMPEYRKEQALIAFGEGGKRAIVSKPSICGWGLNWQHCARMAFLGIGHSYEELYQAIRRIYRFGQQRPCDIHLVLTDRDTAILENLRRKQTEADRLADGMVAAMGDLTRAEIGSAVRETVDYQPATKMQLPVWIAT